jgi:hypothetical protein
MSFASGPTRQQGGHAMIMAHSLLLRVLDSHNTHFKLGLGEALKGNLEDFQKAYGPKEES